MQPATLTWLAPLPRLVTLVVYDDGCSTGQGRGPDGGRHPSTPADELMTVTDAASTTDATQDSDRTRHAGATDGVSGTYADGWVDLHSVPFGSVRRQCRRSGSLVLRGRACQ